MNPTRLIAVLTLTLAFVTASAAFAQPAESTLLAVLDVHIAPGKNADYEQLQKARNARMADGNVTFGTRVSVAQGLPVVYRNTAFGLENMAAFDALRAQLQGMPSGEPGAARGIIHHIESSIRRTRPDLAYIPENARVPVGEAGFLREIDVYLQFGTRTEAEAIVKEVTALYEEHDIRNTFLVSSSVTGSGPSLRFVSPARDAADFYVENQRVTALLGVELQSRLQRMGTLARRVVYTNRMIRRDLGYSPSN